MSFSYLGQAYTAEQFIAYVMQYDFGSVPPSFLVFHHTYSPDASWAPISQDRSSWWDRNESGMDENAIIAKRLRQLDAIMRYYRDVKGWQTGPHIFVDEKYIWLFTPMYEVGTHAGNGNSYRDDSGALHYSIGIEAIGYFERVGWPLSMQKLLAVVTQALKARLANFDIVYHDAPINTPRAHDHSISFHSDYNKPACPGAVITPQYAIPILAAPYRTPYMQYEIAAPCTVLCAPAPDAALATGPTDGQTQLIPGTLINVGSEENGWLHVAPNTTDKPGIGFICASYARRIT